MKRLIKIAIVSIALAVAGLVALAFSNDIPPIRISRYIQA